MACIGTNDSEGTAFSADSPLTNDDDNFHGSSNTRTVLKKGPWTSAEDAILIDYVKKHGEGNWNSVQKQSGLSRCGKSCRLRWANHLRPNLKKGAFTPEEERLIIELHAKMGNKWARMAAHLPGRTDNEIKNYWNTRIKRLQRAGLPLYPPDLSSQVKQENQRNLGSPGISGGDVVCHGILKSDCYETPSVVFDSLNILPYTSEFPDISVSGSLVNGFSYPQFHSFVPQLSEMQKCTQELSETRSNYGGDATYEAQSFDRTKIDGCLESQLFGLPTPYDPEHMKKLRLFGVNDDTHFMSNGNCSASKSFTGAEMYELPSILYQDSSLGVWEMASESLDSLDESPLPGSLPPHGSSPRSSGLLEALIYECTMLNPKRSSNFGRWMEKGVNWTI